MLESKLMASYSGSPKTTNQFVNRLIFNRIVGLRFEAKNNSGINVEGLLMRKGDS